MEESTKETTQNQQLKETLQKYHSVILKVAPNKRLPNLDLLGRQVLSTPQTVIPPQVPVQQTRNHPLGNTCIYIIYISFNEIYLLTFILAWCDSLNAVIKILNFVVKNEHKWLIIKQTILSYKIG